jgi:hypothetical protein
MSSIRLINVSKSYGIEKVLNDHSLDVKGGEHGSEDSSQPFETVILSRMDLVHWPSMLRQIWERLERNEIRIADIRRDGYSIQIILRRLRAKSRLQASGSGLEVRGYTQ